MGKSGVYSIKKIAAMLHGALDGYVIRYLPQNDRRYESANWQFEHRLVMEAVLGRRLKRSEVVHHLDENKKNNKPGNLELLTRSEHGKLHAPLLGKIENCPICGKKFYLSRANEKRGRRTCSNVCGAKLPGAIRNHKRNLTGRKINHKLNALIVKLRNSALTWKEVSELSGVTIPGCRDRYARTYKGPKLKPVSRARKRVHTQCGYCSKMLQVRPSKIKLSKSGLVFCDCHCFGRYNAPKGVIGRPFTASDDRKIKSMWARGANYNQIAKSLGRDRGSIKGRILRKIT